MPAKRSTAKLPECAGRPHIFDKLEVRDRWYSESGEVGWMPCEQQPCSHHYSQPVGVAKDPSWQVAVAELRLKRATK